MKRPNIHGIIYGYNGVGKTRLVAGSQEYNGVPGPRLVIHLDGFGKDSPWIYAGKKVYKVKEDYDLGNGMMVPNRELVGIDNERTRIEYYHSANAYSPNASAMVDVRLQDFVEESKSWGTIVIDSVSALLLEARYYDEMVINPVSSKTGKKDKWSPYNASRMLLERLIMNQRSWQCNVFFILHESYDIVNDGMLKPTFSLPGKMPFEIGRYFSDILRVYVVSGVDKKPSYMVQTSHNGDNIAQNTIFAPNPCEAQWGLLWENWDKMPEIIEEDY